MITYVAEWKKAKDRVFTAMGDALGGAQRLPFIGLSLRDFPESADQARAALTAAKKQPKGRLARFLKFQLIRMQYNWSRRHFRRHPDRIAVCWNGITGSRSAFMQGARDAGARHLYVELAPFPGRVTIDPEGVNALNSVPRDPAFFTRWAAGAPARQGPGWRRLGQNLSARASRRGDVAQGGADALASQGKFLFCPLQVPDDSQIRLFSGWVGSVPAMLDILADAAGALPDDWHIRVKEHPSARVRLGGAVDAAVNRAGGRLVVDNETDTFAQVAGSGGVVTINSSVGLQAFFHDRPVIVLGEAFYALPGLVHLADGPGALHRLLATPEALTFDPALRAAFMNYLDQVYYPRLEIAADGSARLDPAAVRAKLTVESPL